MDSDFFIFDDSLVDELRETKENFKEIIDYLTCINSVGTICKVCLDKIETLSLLEGAKKIIRGIMADDRDIDIDNCPIKSTIRLCNSEAKLKKVLLITNKDYHEGSYKGSLKIISFTELRLKLKKNDEFNLWKSTEIWKIQKANPEKSLPNRDCDHPDSQVEE